MSEYSIEEIMLWCDQKTQEGHEISLEWSGGGDDGWVEVKIDGYKSDDPEAEDIEQLLTDQIGYDWWIGDVSASGEALYDSSTKTFRGVHTTECDAYFFHENNGSMEVVFTKTVDCVVQISLPKTLSIRWCHFMIRKLEEDTYVAIVGGADGLKRLDDNIENAMAVREQIIDGIGDDFEDFYDIDFVIDKEEFVEEENNLVYQNTVSIEVRGRSIEELTIEIDLPKLLNME